MTPEELEKEPCVYCKFMDARVSRTEVEKISLLKQLILETSMIVAAGHGETMNACEVRIVQALEDLENELGSLEAAMAL